jgi:hypothetical protein
MKIKELGNRKIRLILENEYEYKMFDFLYKLNVIKGAYAYKPSDYVEIDTKAYSTQYIVEPELNVEVKEEEVDSTLEFLN